MSQYFDVGDRTLWNPSNGAARLFLRYVRLYEEELGVPSGFGPMENDECAIDPALFETYVNTLLAWQDTITHPVMNALSPGFTATVLVLADRAGVDVRWPVRAGGADRWASLRDSSRALARHMAA